MKDEPQLCLLKSHPLKKFKDSVFFLDLSKDKATCLTGDVISILEHLGGNAIKKIRFNGNKI